MFSQIDRFAISTSSQSTRARTDREGDAEDGAKCYGIWQSRIVASRRCGSIAPESDNRGKGQKSKPVTKFPSLGDELQSDEFFDRDIVECMGSQFYLEEFVPAIERDRANEKSYVDTRDVIREGWKPQESRCWAPCARKLDGPICNDRPAALFRTVDYLNLLRRKGHWRER